MGGLSRSLAFVFGMLWISLSASAQGSVTFKDYYIAYRELVLAPNTGPIRIIDKNKIVHRKRIPSEAEQWFFNHQGVAIALADRGQSKMEGTSCEFLIVKPLLERTHSDDEVDVIHEFGLATVSLSQNRSMQNPKGEIFYWILNVPGQIGEQGGVVPVEVILFRQPKNSGKGKFKSMRKFRGTLSTQPKVIVPHFTDSIDGRLKVVNRILIHLGALRKKYNFYSAQLLKGTIPKDSRALKPDFYLSVLDKIEVLLQDPSLPSEMRSKLKMRIDQERDLFKTT